MLPIWLGDLEIVPFIGLVKSTHQQLRAVNCRKLWTMSLVTSIHSLQKYTYKIHFVRYVLEKYDDHTRRTFATAWQFQLDLYRLIQGAAKVFPKILFAVFSPIAWNFKAKIYRHMYSSYIGRNAHDCLVYFDVSWRDIFSVELKKIAWSSYNLSLTSDKMSAVNLLSELNPNST